MTIRPYKEAAKQYRFLCISDIHLGHPKTTTTEIIASLEREITDAVMASIDLLVIAGDLYDSLLDQSQDETHEIDHWLAALLRLAKKHNVLLYILEGTPSHDAEQPERLKVLNEAFQIGADVKYFPKIEIYYEPRFDASFLFVPDEAPKTAESSWAEVCAQLKAKDLTQVDCAFMHGAFRFQLPDIAPYPKHIEEDYLSIVKHVICIGHVHEHLVYERIHGQGSFERLGHGYQSPKGYLLVNILGDTHEVTFVENVHAKRYDSFTILETDLEKVMIELDALTADLPYHSHVRLILPKLHPLFKNMGQLIQRYPGLLWTTPKALEERIKEKAREQAKPVYQPIYLDKANLSPLILDALIQMGQLTQAQLTLARRHLALA